ncbi:hypothetical protein Bbelb_227820 [Branchiostoma belcheri]|nr:hypothetical protein Bbelb_227820 [Branchiostoma belcheri]
MNLKRLPFFGNDMVIYIKTSIFHYRGSCDCGDSTGASAHVLERVLLFHVFGNGDSDGTKRFTTIRVKLSSSRHVRGRACKFASSPKTLAKIMENKVSGMSILKSSSSEVLRFDAGKGVRETMSVKFKSGDRQTSVLNDIDSTEEGTKLLRQADTLPNCVISAREEQQAVAAPRTSMTIIDDEPAAKKGFCRRVWKSLKKRLSVPACFRLCRPRRD